MSTQRRRRAGDPVPTAALVGRTCRGAVDRKAPTADTGDMAAEVITFEGRRGRRLVGTWHTSETGRPRGAVVVAHGMLSSRASPKHRALCDRAVASDLGGLRFDFAGRGESSGGPTDLTVSGEVDDLLSAIAWVGDHLDGPVAVVGSSLGGTVAVLAAAQTTLAALVTIAAPAKLPVEPRAGWSSASRDDDTPGVEGKPWADVWSGFFDDARRHDPLDAARSVRCPWTVIHGAADDVVPVRHAHMLASAGLGARLVVHPDAGHRFSSPSDRGWLVRQAIGFVADTLAARARDA